MSFKVAVKDAEIGNISKDGYMPVVLLTDRGKIECRHYSSGDSHKAVIFVGGIGGGFDTPARELYSRLSQDLMTAGISSLRVRFRHPTDLDEAVFDILAGIDYLESRGIEKIGLVGHSFGGAAVIRAAVLSNLVQTVVTLASQSYGADVVSKFRPEMSIQIIHGDNDSAISPLASESIYRMAKEPKKLVLHKGSGHGLDEASDEVYREVHDWLVSKLS